MNEEITQEILDELFSSLQALETQSAALVQFMQERGIAQEEELAPYFEQARTASAIRWRASRVRIEHLLAGAAKASERKAEEEKEKQAPAKAAEGTPEPTQAASDSIARSQEGAKDEQPAADSTARSEAGPKAQPGPQTEEEPKGRTSPTQPARGAQTGERNDPGNLQTSPDATDTAA
jgi:hypothetical protein